MSIRKQIAAAAAVLLEMEGSTIEEMAHATGASVDTTRRRCAIRGIAYVDKPTPAPKRFTVPKSNRFPSVWAYAQGRTI